MDCDIDKIRQAVREEYLLSQEKISEADVKVEFVYEEYIDEDDEKIIIDKNKLFAELIYENMTYYDNYECNCIDVRMTETYLKDTLGDCIITSLLYEFIDMIIERDDMGIDDE